MGVLAILSAVTPLLSKLIPDPAQRAEAEANLLKLHQAGELKELESATNIIVAEAKSDHWIVAAWRPLIMLMFGFIIANNFILYPYLSLFWESAPKLEIPPDLWDIIKIGLGGYVVGRSVEKSVKGHAIIKRT